MGQALWHVASAVIVGYLVGSVPVPYLAVRLVTGSDLREQFTGNVGVMNAAHVLGRWRGAGVFCAELAKGMLAAAAGARLGGQGLAWAAIVAAVVGANWSIWLGWAGGRGNTTFGGGTLATTDGVYLVALILSQWLVLRPVLRDAFRATRASILLLPVDFAVWSWWQAHDPVVVAYYTAVGVALATIFLSKHSRATDDHMVLRAGAYGRGD